MTERTTLGGRLERALDDWGEGIMAFVEAMKDELEGTDVQGATYPAIKRYLDDEAVPSVRFLEAAARVLGVRPAWLVLGDGDMTEEEARGREGVEDVSRTAFEAEAEALRRYRTMRLQRAVLHALGRGHPPVPEPPEGLDSVGDLGGNSEEAVEWREAVDRAFRSRTIHPWAAPLAEAIRRLDVGSGTSLDDPVRFPLGLHRRIGAEDVGRALRGPLEALDVNPALMGRDALDEHVLAMVPALMALAPERERQIDRRERAAGDEATDANRDGEE